MARLPVLFGVTIPDRQAHLRPNPVVLKAFLARSTRLWLLTRLMLLVLVVVPAIEFHPLSVMTAFGVAALATAIGFLEISIRGDRHLLGNLGVGRAALLAMVMIPALVGELVLFGVGMLLA